MIMVSNTIWTLLFIPHFVCSAFRVTKDDSMAIIFRQKDIKVEKAEPCTSDKTLPISIVKFELLQPKKNVYKVNCVVEVKEDLRNPLYFQTFMYRCDPDSSNCENLDLEVTPNICQHLEDRHAIYTPIFDYVKPPFRCPVRKGVYRVDNGGFDLSIMTRFPIEPGKRTFNLTLFDYQPGDLDPSKKKRRLLTCLDVELIITLSRTKPSAPRRS